ncbi:DUF4153 domain-containing protein [Ruegeria pomeroyi]|uniref:Membrane protein, putative n=2 Tax=Ruegeria pomeroyi TaxID=89184 RepID=Q5LPV0_RUEPO|nr:DUF4153 domain-containing protein [Ruegeria pomeroyi]AAV95990.1 membrane protein, putative [Ruegeria pomeroyi DSS-3]NVK97640.1 DUF4153 domain-containing protein [Ruegeria pomeroyi]NVL02769.1 DUF4153 domain-containing protein [Ruegeria pomeroyi]QWV09552.1 DUF4153 domain-containing protein [Ruegeria pomeroyi]
MTDLDVAVAIRDRLAQAVAGTLAALALWALAEVWGRDILPERVWLCLLSLVLVHAGATLALAGPVGLVRGSVISLWLSLPATLLTWSVAGRFEPASRLLQHPQLVLALVGFVFIALPFLVVRAEGRGRMFDYASLFAATWETALRFVLAWVFVGLFWGVLLLSDALLDLVGVGVIDLILEEAVLFYALSGAVLGFALAVIHEVRGRVSPYPVLRLLRLLLPVLLSVMALFLAALPLRGLNALFGDLSSAMILLATAAAAITLISTALDRDEAHAVASPGLRASTRALAILLPLPIALAIWALGIRVIGYGWTPARLFAALSAGLMAIYGLGYCLLALRGGDWTARLRRFNVTMAVLLLVAAALWLTPLLDSLRISTASQVARYADARAGRAELPIWEMTHDWGHAGQVGLAQLRALAVAREDAGLIRALDRAREVDSRYLFETPELSPNADLVPELVARMQVRPIGAVLSEAELGGLPQHQLQIWRDGCARPLPDGRPGCVLMRGAFSPVAPAGDQAIVLYLDELGLVRATHLRRNAAGDLFLRPAGDPRQGDELAAEQLLLMQALDGEFAIVPSGQQALAIGGVLISPRD